MRRLYLMRHAKSCWDDPSLDDFDRPLNKRGKKAARRMAAHFRQAGVAPSLILCSSAKRTIQTLDLLGPALEGIAVSVEPAIYDAAMDTLRDRLGRLDDAVGAVLLIGHNPGLARLAEALAGGNGDPAALKRLSAKLPTGALVTLESDIAHWADLAEGSCRLVSLVAPADLAGD